MVYVYPAVLTPEGEGWSVEFPDVEGAITCGDDLAQALAMAQDALALMLTEMEKDQKTPNKPTAMEKVAREAGEIVTLVRADTEE